MGERAQLEEIQTLWAASPVPIYATLGNHEIGGDDDTAWRDVFGRHGFHFVFHGVGFIFADAESASLDPLVYDQLENCLHDDRAHSRIFISHIPPFDPNGIRSATFRSRSEAGKLMALLSKKRTGFCLHGHIHTYHLYRQAGILSLLSGGSSHFTVLDIDPLPGVVTPFPIWIE